MANENQNFTSGNPADFKKGYTHAGGAWRFFWKGDGEPGVKTIWQGYDKLLHYIEAADAFGV